MYDQPGDRVPVTNPEGADPIASGAPCVLGGHVGFIEKTEQLDRWVKPGSTEATHVMEEESAVLFIADCHKLPLAGGLSGAAVGDKLYIDPADNTVHVTNVGTGAKNEVQEVTVKAKKGTFKVAFQNEQTAAIKFNATAEEVQDALEALGGIDPGDIVVTGGPGDELGTKPYVLTFGGQFADEDVEAVTTDASALEEGAHTAAVTTKTGGVSAAVLPLGVIDSIDTAPTPDVALVNLSDLKPFLTV